MQDGEPLKPFLKWPGGKVWIAATLAKLLRRELLGTYYEPFFGAGAVFFALAPHHAVLSDVNAALIEAIETIRTQPDAVVRATQRYSNSEICYHRVRRMKPRTTVGEAARFLFLNRTCWGGVYRLNRAGEFNVPFGNSGRTICKKEPLLKGAKRLRSAIIIPSDFENMVDQARKGDVVYADPPYTTKGQNNGFVRYNEHLFAWADQVRLATACKRAVRRGVFVAVSGLWHDEFLSLYDGWFWLKVNRSSTVSRKLSGRHPVNEAIVFSRKPRGDQIASMQ